MSRPAGFSGAGAVDVEVCDDGVGTFDTGRVACGAHGVTISSMAYIPGAASGGRVIASDECITPSVE